MSGDQRPGERLSDEEYSEQYETRHRFDGSMTDMMIRPVAEDDFVAIAVQHE